MKETNEMKANELMIGDWVMTSSGMPRRVMELSGIVEDYIILEDGTESGFNPIPLTPEILEKNGFTESEIECNEFSDVGLRYTYETQDGCFAIIDWQDSFDNGYGRWEERWIIEAFGCNGTFKTNPHERIYIHELQHALRLCGLTELADNFKIE